MSTGAYDAYVFDLYGTLIDIRTDEDDPVLWRRMEHFLSCQGADYEPGTLHAGFLAAQAGEMDRARACSGGQEDADYQVEDVFRALYAQAGVDPRQGLVEETCRFFRHCSTSKFRVYDSVHRVLATLRDRGRRIFLLSNAQSVFTRPELVAAGLDSAFEAVWISSEKGIMKPGAGFLLSLLDAHGLEPRRTLMVGNDLGTDVEVAVRAGVDAAFLYTNHSRKEWLPLARERARHVIADGDISRLLDLDLAPDPE